MDNNDARVCEALRRITLLTETVRWVWAVNMIAMIIGLVRGHYGLAGLAGFSWIVALTATAAGRRAIKQLEAINRPSAPSRRPSWELEEETR